MKNKQLLVSLGVLGVIVAGWFLWMWLALGDDAASNNNTEEPTITSFEECVEAGYPVMESYPRQCSVDGETFVEEIQEEEEEAPADEAPENGSAFTSEKGVELQLDIERGQQIASPFTLTGEVPGNWSFEADFPVELVNSEGETLTEAPATLQGDWMTTELVPFTVELEFPNQPAGSEGTLILHKDNPSGLVENADKLEVDISF